MKAGWGDRKKVIIALAVLMISGCSALMVEDGIDRTLVEEDIIAMSKAGIGSGVITKKIEVTRSQFSMTADEIIRLKKEDVSDKVIEAMINSGEAAKEFDLERSYSLYDYWFNYYNTFYPTYIYADPSFPYPYFSPGPYGYPLYRWSEQPGRFYRYFPVGLPGRYPGRYPIPFISPEDEEVQPE